MKKLVLLLSFVFALGLFSVSAQGAPKKEVKKTPAKTETTAKPAKIAPVKKSTHKSGKKSTTKKVAPAK